MHHMLIIITASYLGSTQMPEPMWYEVPTQDVCEHNKIKYGADKILCVDLNDSQLAKLKSDTLVLKLGRSHSGLKVRLGD